jgi:hypothetical protein
MTPHKQSVILRLSKDQFRLSSASFPNSIWERHCPRHSMAPSFRNEKGDPK